MSKALLLVAYREYCINVTTFLLTFFCLIAVCSCETVNPICNENYCVEIYPKSQLPEGAEYDDLSEFGGPATLLDTDLTDTDPPRVIGGTVRDGDRHVDSEEINTDGVIEVAFSEEVTGNIALQTEAGDDVGWLGSFEGNTGILYLVAGTELGGETVYVITGNVSDAAGNETAISITFATAWAPFIHKNLIDHWQFDERKGGVATNSIGPQDGEIFGAKWTPNGKFDYALEFDGVDDSVVIQDYATSGMTENISFMAWFRPAATLTNRAFIVTHDAFYVSFSEQEQLKFGVHPNDISIESTDNIDNRWYYHIAVTFDGKTMRIYIDGELNSEMPHDVPMTSSEADLVIGQGFAGIIDEVRIYDKALSEDEIEVAMGGWDFW